MSAGAPTLVVAGAQRSASTSLAQQLGRHPGIAMEEREVTSLEDPYYPQALPWLLDRVAAAHRRGLVAAFKRPELLHGPACVERMARHLRGVVAVISLREPVARTVSAYRHYLRHGLLPALGLDQGLRRLLDRRARGDVWEPGDQVLDYSLYAAGVRRFLDEGAIDTVVAFHDELVAGAGSVGAGILARLGLPPADLGPFPAVNGRPPLDRLGLERVANRLCYDIDHDRRTLQVTGNVLRRAAGSGLRRVAAVLPPEPAHRAELDPALRQRLVDLLAPDATELERLLGRPLPPAWQASLAR